MIENVFLSLGYSPIERQLSGSSGLKHKFLYTGYNDHLNSILLMDDCLEIKESILKFYDVESSLRSKFNIIMCYFDQIVFYHSEVYLDRVLFREFSSEAKSTDRNISENIHDFFSDHGVPIQLVNSLSQDPPSDYGYKEREKVLKKYKKNRAMLRHQGIAVIGINDFNWEQLNILMSEKDIRIVSNILKERRIYQYFYPPEDDYVIGSIAKQNNTLKGIKDVAQFSKNIGHPFSDKSIIKTDGKIQNIEETIQLLSEHGYIIEKGKMGFYLGDKGKEAWGEFEFKPEENIFEKLIKRFSVNIKLNISDLLKTFKG